MSADGFIIQGRCPRCFREIDGLTHLASGRSDVEVNEGDVSICIYCLGFLKLRQFPGWMQWVELTDEEFIDRPVVDRKLLLTARLHLRIAKENKEINPDE